MFLVKCHQLVQAGCRQFNLPTSILTRITVLQMRPQVFTPRKYAVVAMDYFEFCGYGIRSLIENTVQEALLP